MASLLTSKDCIPGGVKRAFGCINIPDINFNCYFFEAGVGVGVDKSNSSFAFPKDTFIYGYRIDCFNINKLNLSQVSKITSLYPHIYDDVILCLKMSSSVKRKFKKML